jgi:folate-dependent phosphoribosylglycinamide formyltransferase PurN
MLKLGWFSTGRDKAARELLQTVWHSISEGKINAEISFVFSNREPGESAESDKLFALVRSYELPLIHLSSRRFKGEANWRQMYDREVMRLVEDFPIDLCILAGYVLIVGKEMCTKYNMLNLHPAAPGGPVVTWQEVIWRLIAEGAEESGVMLHLVTPELDMGPPVTYCSFSLRGEPFDRYWQEIEGIPVEEIKAKQGGNNPLFKRIREQGLAREFPLIVSTLKAFGEGRLKVVNKRIISADGEVDGGYNLTREINDELHLLRP